MWAHAREYALPYFIVAMLIVMGMSKDAAKSEHDHGRENAQARGHGHARARRSAVVRALIGMGQPCRRADESADEGADEDVHWHGHAQELGLSRG